MRVKCDWEFFPFKLLQKWTVSYWMWGSTKWSETFHWDDYLLPNRDTCTPSLAWYMPSVSWGHEWHPWSQNLRRLSWQANTLRTKMCMHQCISSSEARYRKRPNPCRPHHPPRSPCHSFLNLNGSSLAPSLVHPSHLVYSESAGSDHVPHQLPTLPSPASSCSRR